jgi:hypothetical protein
MLNPKIYGMLGDVRMPFTSVPFENYLKSLREKGFEVQIVADSTRELNNIVYDIVSQPPSRMIALVGYSLGANGCAWIQQALRVYWRRNADIHLQSPVRPIALIVGFDPTKNSRLDLYPIESHVQRCLLFQQCAWWFPTSLFYGRGAYVRHVPDGPAIETTRMYADHLWMQDNEYLKGICTGALLAEDKKWQKKYETRIV